MISFNDAPAEAPLPQFKQINCYQPEFPAPRPNIQTQNLVVYVPLMN